MFQLLCFSVLRSRPAAMMIGIAARYLKLFVARIRAIAVPMATSVMTSHSSAAGQ